MKKKALALAVAGAFFAPASYAAQDTSGMQYTSAAEGFYASIRARFHTEKGTDTGAGIEDSSSRFGVRGTNDLGNGLKGFYQYEAGVSIDNGGDLSTRVGQVGLEGAFGRVWAGSGWAESYGMTYGSTDVANTGSGSIVYGKHNGMRQGRLSNMIQYRTPDISGFQGALGINVKSGADNDPASESEAPERVGITDGVVNGNPARVPHVLAKRAADKDDNDVEMWTIAAKYGVQGFTGAFAYSVKPDSYAVGVFSKSLNDRYTSQIENTAKEDANGNYVDLMQTKDDYSAWTAKLGYSQDNWYVNGWYGKNNDSDFRYTYTANKKLNDAGDAYVDATEYARSHSPEDSKFVSIAGGVSVDKVNMYAVWEQFDYGNGEDATTVIGVQYNLGSRSRVWMDFINQDLDSNSKAEDHVMVGLRHDF